MSHWFGVFESPRRFNLLPRVAKPAVWFREREEDCPGSRVESFRLREIRHAVSVNGVRDALGSWDQRGLGNGADVQIGGGVRVGDAFQAIVGFNLIAMWGVWFCVEISQTGHSCLVRFEQERYAPASRKACRRRGKVGRLKRRRWLNDWMFGRGRLNLKQTRDDNLPWEIAARGGGCMLYGISVVFAQVPFSNDALLEALDVACIPPPARTPDGPPSTPWPRERFSSSRWSDRGVFAARRAYGCRRSRAWGRAVAGTLSGDFAGNISLSEKFSGNDKHGTGSLVSREGSVAL